MEQEKKVYVVSELTRLIKSALENTFGSLWLEGELSNVRRPSSGHYYLTLKDDAAQISGVLFRGNQRGLKFRPADGMKVRVFGEISVYERAGNYQIIIRSMEESGKGALQERFEKLKKKLKAEGLFDPERKKPLPMLPRHVGIVTSETGAAIRDILNVINRRFSNLHIVLAPVRVQGDGAEREIAEGIRQLNRLGGLDVLIVGRGGGSIEDLWCFNEECVARSIADSSIPVISAVGHEIDFTITDFAADLRAPTPSAAAELVVGRKDDFEEKISATGRRLAGACAERLLRARNALLEFSGSYVFREPGNLAKQYFQRIDGLQMQMTSALKAGAEKTRGRIHDLKTRAGHAAAMQLREASERTGRCEAQLRSLNPLAVLGRGYSITRGPDGAVLRSTDSLKKGQRIVTRLHEGSFTSEIAELSGEEKGETQ